MSPGSTNFIQWIKTYTSQINGYLGVDTDICAFGDATHESETVIDVISKLLESHFIYYDDLEKTPLTERGILEIPHISMPKFFYLRVCLDGLKDLDPSIEPPAFNFDLDTLEGGFDA